MPPFKRRSYNNDGESSQPYSRGAYRGRGRGGYRGGGAGGAEEPAPSGPSVTIQVNKPVKTLRYVVLHLTKAAGQEEESYSAIVQRNQTYRYSRIFHN